jgi:hypothetical protein
LALYGSVYLLPQYLTIVQGYSAFQTGLAMVWIGLPQLVIFPFVPKLMVALLIGAILVWLCHKTTIKQRSAAH